MGIVLRTQILLFGVGALAVAGLSTASALQKQSWPEVPARITSINTKCVLSSSKREFLTKTTSKAEIDCDQVDAFKRLYDDQVWMVTPKSTAHLSFQAQGAMQQADLELGNIEPEGSAGDTLTIRYDPAKPGKISLPKDLEVLSAGNAIWAGGGVLALTLGVMLRGGRRIATRAA